MLHKTNKFDASNYPIQRVRENDYQKMDSESKKSLFKEITVFKAATLKTYGEGIRILGSYHKKSSKSDKNKEYYLCKHQMVGYFACEVLAQLGINTPKTRITKKIDTDNENKETLYLASKSIPDYIPMCAVDHSKFASKDIKDIKEIRASYKIDFEKQLIIDGNNRKYKISGNVYGSDIAARIISDFDFQPMANNFGLNRVGNRFYAAAIDKDFAVFSGETYSELLDTPLLEQSIAGGSYLYKYKTLDQSLVIIHSIALGLAKDSDGKCIFDKIFCNSRVEATSELSSIKREYCENFKKTAQSTLDYFYEKQGKNFLEEFNAREEIRKEIAKKIIKKMQLKPEWENLIIEDLRAPYYKDFFINQVISEKDLNNDKLIAKIINDIENEIVDFHYQNVNESTLDWLRNNINSIYKNTLKNKSSDYAAAVSMRNFILKTLEEKTTPLLKFDKIIKRLEQELPFLYAKQKTESIEFYQSGYRQLMYLLFTEVYSKNLRLPTIIPKYPVNIESFKISSQILTQSQESKSNDKNHFARRIKSKKFSNSQTMTHDAKHFYIAHNRTLKIIDYETGKKIHEAKIPISVAEHIGKDCPWERIGVIPEKAIMLSMSGVDGIEKTMLLHPKTYRTQQKFRFNLELRTILPINKSQFLGKIQSTKIVSGIYLFDLSQKGRLKYSLLTSNNNAANYLSMTLLDNKKIIMTKITSDYVLDDGQIIPFHEVNKEGSDLFYINPNNEKISIKSFRLPMLCSIEKWGKQAGKYICEERVFLPFEKLAIPRALTSMSGNKFAIWITVTDNGQHEYFKVWDCTNKIVAMTAHDKENFDFHTVWPDVIVLAKYVDKKLILIDRVTLANYTVSLSELSGDIDRIWQLDKNNELRISMNSGKQFYIRIGEKHQLFSVKEKTYQENLSVLFSKHKTGMFSRSVLEEKEKDQILKI